MLTHFQIPKLIMITELYYRFDINLVNKVIYQKNLILYKELYRTKTSVIFDCNNVCKWDGSESYRQDIYMHEMVQSIINMTGMLF